MCERGISFCRVFERFGRLIKKRKGYRRGPHERAIRLALLHARARHRLKRIFSSFFCLTRRAERHGRYIANREGPALIPARIARSDGALVEAARRAERTRHRKRHLSTIARLARDCMMK